MKEHRFLIVVLLVALALLVSGCASSAPEEGSIVRIPDEGISGWYVKADQSGLKSCTIPGGYALILRNTYWETWEGAIEQYQKRYISEIAANGQGSCNLVDDDTLNDLSTVNNLQAIKSLCEGDAFNSVEYETYCK